MGSMQAVPLLGAMMAAAGDIFVHFDKTEQGWKCTNGPEVLGSLRGARLTQEVYVLVQAMQECSHLVDQGVPIIIFPEVPRGATLTVGMERVVCFIVLYALPTPLAYVCRGASLGMAIYAHLRPRPAPMIVEGNFINDC